jgi:hypothetical protein
VRFWQLQDPGDRQDYGQYGFWRQKFHTLIGANDMIWVGAATEDIFPISIRWRTGQLTHHVSDDSDRERDFIIQTLTDSKLVASTSQTEPGETIRFRSQQLRTHFVADGGLKVVKLK